MDMPKALHIYKELRNVAQKYKNKHTSTGNIIISEMATDAADAIEYLSNELFEMEKRKIK